MGSQARQPASPGTRCPSHDSRAADLSGGVRHCVRITVTKHEIRSAREEFQKNPFARCPVALAISAAIGLPVAIGSHVFVGDPDLNPFPPAYPIPLEAAEWMSRYDRDESVKSFSFEFPWPQQPVVIWANSRSVS